MSFAQDFNRVYPPPPWSYVGTRVLNVFCRTANAQALHQWVPAPLRPTRDDGFFVLWFLGDPSIPEVGPDYTSSEGGILIPARTADGAVVGATFATMIVDNDVALAGGREIWGLPKQLGTVRFEVDGSTVSVAAHRSPIRDGRGDCLFSAKVDLDGSGVDTPALLAALEPRLVRRTIPDPFGPGAQSDDIVVIRLNSAMIHELRTGRAEVRFGDGVEEFAELGPIEALGAVYRVCDFVLPYGQSMAVGTTER